MAENIMEKIKAYNEKHMLIKEHDRLIVGVSGGADSVCLFFLLLELQRDIPFEFRVVHVHHGIREEAEGDLQYVEQICKQNQILCYSFRENIPELVRKTGMTEEEAGRKVRYQNFNKVLEGWKNEVAKQQEVEVFEKNFKIATAHHMNDQAETLLFQLFRGSGISGLCGIWPQKDNLIRPALCLEKAEMEQYLNGRKIPFCIDSTNEEEKYARNKIRRRVIPYIDKEICNNASKHLTQTAERMQEAENYIQKEISRIFNIIAKAENGTILLEVNQMVELDPFMQKEIVFYAITQTMNSKKDMTAEHVDAICNLARKNRNGRVSLPYGLIVEKEYNKLYFYIKETEMVGMDLTVFCQETGMDKAWFQEKKPEIITNIVSKEEIIKNQTMKIDDFESNTTENSISDYLKNNALNLYTQFIDYDKIETGLDIRHRQTGDYYIISQQGNRKSLKKFLIEKKVPQKYRDRLWLIADGNCIVWIPGLRLGDQYKISESTKKIMQIQWKDYLYHIENK